MSSLPPAARLFKARPSPGIRLFLLILIALQIAFCWSARKGSLDGEVDLRAFYSAGVALRTGHAHELYNSSFEAANQLAIFGQHGRTLPFLYPAFAAIPFGLLSVLPYSTAFVLFFLLNLSLLVVCAWLLVGSLQASPISPGWLAAAFVAFFPTTITLMQGQVSFVLLLVYTCFYLLVTRQRHFLAGLVLALGLVKLQIVLPVVLLYLLWRNYSIVLGFLLGACIVVPLSIAVTGIQGFKLYLARLRGVGSSTLLDPLQARKLYGMQTSLEPNLHGFLTRLIGPHPLAAILTLVLSLLVLAVCVRARPSLATALPAAMLVSYHMQPYELVLLLLPFTILLLEDIPATLPRNAFTRQSTSCSQASSFSSHR